VTRASRQLALWGAAAALTFVLAVELQRSDNLPFPPPTVAWVAFPASPKHLGRCVAAGLADRPPRKIVDVNPVFPAGVWTRGGVLLLSATVDERGDVIEVEVVRSHPPFDDAAVAAVRKWKFEPALMHGRATCIVMTVSVTIDVR
jgi:protein TonB